jgi:hypothetical protein
MQEMAAAGLALSLTGELVSVDAGSSAAALPHCWQHHMPGNMQQQQQQQQQQPCAVTDLSQCQGMLDTTPAAAAAAAEASDAELEQLIMQDLAAAGLLPGPTSLPVVQRGGSPAAAAQPHLQAFEQQQAEEQGGAINCLQHGQQQRLCCNAAARCGMDAVGGARDGTHVPDVPLAHVAAAAADEQQSSDSVLEQLITQELTAAAAAAGLGAAANSPAAISEPEGVIVQELADTGLVLAPAAGHALPQAGSSLAVLPPLMLQQQPSTCMQQQQQQQDMAPGTHGASPDDATYCNAQLLPQCSGSWLDTWAGLQDSVTADAASWPTHLEASDEELERMILQELAVAESAATAAAAAADSEALDRNMDDLLWEELAAAGCYMQDV